MRLLAANSGVGHGKSWRWLALHDAMSACSSAFKGAGEASGKLVLHSWPRHSRAAHVAIARLARSASLAGAGAGRTRVAWRSSHTRTSRSKAFST